VQGWLALVLLDFEMRFRKVKGLKLFINISERRRRVWI